MILAAETLTISYTSTEYTAIAPEGIATQRVKLQANMMSQTKTYNSFLHVLCYAKETAALSGKQSPADVFSSDF